MEIFINGVMTLVVFKAVAILLVIAATAVNGAATAVIGADLLCIIFECVDVEVSDERGKCNKRRSQ